MSHFYMIEDLTTGEVWGMNGWCKLTPKAVGEMPVPTWDTFEEANTELKKLTRGTVERYDEE